MKKLHLLLLMLLIAFSFSSCKKENEEEKLAPKQTQYGFAINYTARWCGPCGNWGAQAIHSLHDVDADKVVAITAHAGSGDPMHNSDLYYTFSAQNQRPTGGVIPSFYVGDIKTDDTTVMTTLLAQTPIAGMDMKSSKKDGKMKVEAQVKFFDDGVREYYISVLMLEDGIDGGNSAPSNYQQNGTNDPDYKHDFVLRASHVQGNSYGELIATDPVSGKTFDVSAEIDIDNTWDEVYPVLLLWQKSANGFYKFVNAFK